jgi:lauroyl/myristoyl acyltransferase
MNAAARMWSERVLRFLIRYLGALCLLALVPVFMPYSWMDGIHRALGMGTLPAELSSGGKVININACFGSSQLIWTAVTRNSMHF